MLSKIKITLALGMAWSIAPSVAVAESINEDAPTRLSDITVSSTRSERRVDTVPNTVTVTTAAKIEENGARDIKDIFRDELDVTVRAAPTRFTAAGSAVGRAGNEGINIRGLEGNQVLMMVDGIRLPNSFSFGAFATGRGDFLNVDSIKNVEVLRGPASAQFGSDGLAGAVNFQTLNPSDLLKTGQAINGFARSSYATVDNSWSNTLGVAGGTGLWQGIVLGNYVAGHEVDNKGNNDVQNVNRTTPNPVDYDNQYLLAKLLLTPHASQQIGLTFETQKRNQDTEVYSARALPPLAATSAIDLQTKDQIKRDRFSLNHRYTDVNATWLQRAQTHLYWQKATISQGSVEDRNTAVDRTRVNDFGTKVVGASTQLESNFQGDVSQRWTYGADWSRAEITGVRNGTVPPMGETFPTKPFPDTAYTLAGVFVQDEIEVAAVSIIPSLRFDHYMLSPNTAGYVGGKAVSLSGQAVTPRLGVVWNLLPAFAPYGQIATGFRAPTPDQVNNGFTNLASGYTSVGNPNLKDERALSVELGFRGKVDAVRYSLATFDNRYKDFISQQMVGGSGSAADPTVYQYINLNRARIRGVEIRGEWSMTNLWTIRGGAAYAKGESDIRGEKTPLDTVAPLKAVFAVDYRADRWGAHGNLIHSQGKKEQDIAPLATQVKPFATPSYTIFNLGFYRKFINHLTLNANLNNVLDSKYWRWSDASGLADNSVIKDAYTAPGRNVQVSLRYDFF